MKSKISLISAGSCTSTEIGCELFSESECIAGVRVSVTNSSFCADTSGNTERVSKTLWHVASGCTDDVEVLVEVIGSDDLHETREALVQPQVVPPLHRHQVAEPLHTRNVIARSRSAHDAMTSPTWCASSCATTMATYSRFESELTFSSYNNVVMRYVMRPQFSIAPAAKSGMAIKSGKETLLLNH